MAEFDNTNRITLWMEEDKKNVKGPDFKGTVNVDGTEYWVSVWKRKTNSGKKMLSGSIEPKEKTRSKANSREGEDQDDGW